MILQCIIITKTMTSAYYVLEGERAASGFKRLHNVLLITYDIFLKLYFNTQSDI